MGFSWVVDNKLAGMARPGSRQPAAEDFAFIGEQGIEVLFSLTEEMPALELAGEHGVEVVHLPVKDFTAPTLAQLEEFVAKASVAIGEERAVGVHCGAGKGRTGTFLAAYFVAQGMTAAEAIARIRYLRPGSVETAAQEQIIAKYQKRLSAVAPKERPTQ
jgi:atypical dual specificity phosphatase